MELKNKLKGRHIYIDNDYTPEQRKIHTSIKIKAKEERSKGTEIKIFYNRLIAGDKCYVWNKQKACLEEKAPVVHQSNSKN